MPTSAYRWETQDVLIPLAFSVMVGQISTRLAEAGLNIADLLNKSKGGVAYTLIDIDGKVPAGLVEKIGSIQGVLGARAVA